MKYLCLFFIISLISNYHFSQESLTNNLTNLQGIWVSVDYYKSFEQTKSSVKSKNTFEPDEPVALRVNLNELKNQTLNIGYSRLHDHIYYPEISNFIISSNNDTINEQGSFQINVSQKDSSNFYPTSEIYFFSDEGTSYFSWEYGLDTNLILYRPKSKLLDEKKIIFKRISKTFENAYEFPNPLYFYSRTKMLVGNYILKDSLNKQVASNFQIFKDGRNSGYSFFDNKIFYFSTDVYCGPDIKEEIVSYCSDIDSYDNECESYVYLAKNNCIKFYKPKWITNKDGTETFKKGKLMFTLIRK